MPGLDWIACESAILQYFSYRDGCSEMGQYIPLNSKFDANVLADLLLAIEAEMRSCGVWGKIQPENEALQSRSPFCGDTLSLEEWLQWIFLPRMKDLLESGKSLPRRCDIAPYAQKAWQSRIGELSALLALIRQFDDVIYRLHETIKH